ncbi:hypothetical protein [Bradyrhizobium macuxiense]|uniref:hypothetical protein n=1 Tax=Bradyrhizobium macuxiense TaxID=1755647 RepID=UPI00142EC6C1|nr:hypothetical protein [Bradyrhizobium macuxiense]
MAMNAAAIAQYAMPCRIAIQFDDANESPEFGSQITSARVHATMHDHAIAMWRCAASPKSLNINQRAAASRIRAGSTIRPRAPEPAARFSIRDIDDTWRVQWLWLAQKLLGDS